MSKKILRQKPPREKEVEKWLQKEIAEQRERYQKIAHSINVELADQREKWYREFETRLQTTGFNWHADNKRLIKPEEIYKKPDREHRVVY
ncbi:MAG TPA: hypothetical protein VNJ29_03225 [Candidatus Nitrosotenuis sp.]|nr:hypothetical protein [Candidatus Nitrosotenuis sp.]